MRKSNPKKNVPHLLRLPDGRRLFVEVPVEWTTRDRGGRIAFLPAAVRYLDQVRAAALEITQPPTPGHVRALRETLSLTQAQFAKRIGVDKLTVSRWERGAIRPNAESTRRIERLRRAAARRGIVIAA